MPTIQPGTHLVHVKSHVLAKTSTGKEQLAVTFEDENGDLITWYGYFTDQAIQRTTESLKILGWKPEEHDYRVASLHGTDLLVGAEAEIVVENEEYDGKTRPKVRWVNSPGSAGGVREILTDEEAGSFSQRMRAAFVTAKPPAANSAPGPNGGGKKPPPKAAPKAKAAGAEKPATADGEDIPF